MRKSAQVMAFSGMFAALAVVVMSLGGLIPIATYVCPVVCSVILYMVMSFCGKRTGWVWFVCVSMLSLLLGPDKEAGAVFLSLGYYPLLKPRFDSLPAKWLFKLAFFNLVSGVLYTVLLFVMGMEHLLQEWNEIGIMGFLITLALGNLCFILLDIALARFSAKTR